MHDSDKAMCSSQDSALLRVVAGSCDAAVPDFATKLGRTPKVVGETLRCSHREATMLLHIRS